MGRTESEERTCGCCRREFLRSMGVAGTAAVLAGSAAPDRPAEPVAAQKKQPAVVRAAFLYPPSETLRKAGYWSWPGSTFDAEGRQRQYTEKLRACEQKLQIRLALDEKPLDDPAGVARFIAEVKQSNPDGLLLIPFKKSHWEHVLRIIAETQVPAVVLATLGVLLSDHINQLHRKPGVYLICAPDDLGAVQYGLKMLRTARRMKDGRILNIAGAEPKTARVANLDTEIRTIPHARFVEHFQRCQATPEVQALAAAYRKNAKQVVQPTDADILEAAKCYFVLKQLLEAEQADAVMMDCLPGLRIPHKHVPPCMAFMSLRDEGIPAGCQADLSATLSLMLVENLFDKPGFQQNAGMNTEQNLFFGAHCTSPSKMNGREGPAEPYMLMSHAEAGWGCVPRVLFAPGQEVTMCQYVPAKEPLMYIYSGKVVRCPDIPPTGGCRTNVEMTINELPDVCDVKGMHQVIFYGNHARHLRAFCQLYGIKAVS